MSTKLSRRDFLKLSAALGLTGLAFRPFSGFEANDTSGDLARVTIHSVSVYAQPDDKSLIQFQHYRDDIVNLYYAVDSPAGPEYNPIWYRVWGGYMHRANMQPVEVKYNPIASNILEGGQLAEVTVPYSQSMYYRSNTGWQPQYRLYYQSTHWVTGIDEGPDGEPWYRLKDELLEVEYHVPAFHLRLIPAEELAPITPELEYQDKWIKVDRYRQRVTCYEKDQAIFEAVVSTGLNYEPEGEIPWKTPKGEYTIQSKMPSKHMGNGNLTGNVEDYELPGVPWTCFFVPETGVAFHGTYWHDDFGTQRSHGCVNMHTEDAKWLFRWTRPVADPQDIEKNGYGTRVVVE